MRPKSAKRGVNECKVLARSFLTLVHITSTVHLTYTPNQRYWVVVVNEVTGKAMHPARGPFQQREAVEKSLSILGLTVGQIEYLVLETNTNGHAQITGVTLLPSVLS
jgi:hypothetical protein